MLLACLFQVSKRRFGAPVVVDIIKFAGRLLMNLRSNLRRRRRRRRRSWSGSQLARTWCGRLLIAQLAVQRCMADDATLHLQPCQFRPPPPAAQQLSASRAEFVSSDRRRGWLVELTVRASGKPFMSTGQPASQPTTTSNEQVRAGRLLISPGNEQRVAPTRGLLSLFRPTLSFALGVGNSGDLHAGTCMLSHIRSASNILAVGRSLSLDWARGDAKLVMSAWLAGRLTG